jgi:uncharacterized protein
MDRIFIARAPYTIYADGGVVHWPAMTDTRTEPEVLTVTEPWDKPWPSIDADSEPFFDGLREHKLLLFRCKTCRAWYWPKAYCRNHANEPFMGNLEWEEASGRGKVFSFNVHHMAFHPGFKDEIPYVYAIVETDEGPLISSTLLDVDPKAVKVGLPVRIVFEDHPTEGFTLPRFRLV